MRDKNYKIKTLRVSEEVWSKLKENRRKSGLSWNLYIKQLTEKK